MAASTTQNGAENEALREPLLSPSENNNNNSQGQQAGGNSVDIPSDKDVVFPKWITPWRDRSLPPARLNHNVALTLLLDVCYGISDSLWSGTVVAAYLKALGGGKNTLVGDIEAVNGLAGMYTSPIVVLYVCVFVPCHASSSWMHCFCIGLVCACSCLLFLA